LTLTLTLLLTLTKLEANRSVGAPILQLGNRSSIIKKRVICEI
jgi:hypothetical protein